MSDAPAEPTRIRHSCGSEIEASIHDRFNLNYNYKPRVIEFDEQGIVINQDS